VLFISYDAKRIAFRDFQEKPCRGHVLICSRLAIPSGRLVLDMSNPVTSLGTSSEWSSQFCDKTLLIECSGHLAFFGRLFRHSPPHFRPFNRKICVPRSGCDTFDAPCQDPMGSWNRRVDGGNVKSDDSTVRPASRRISLLLPFSRWPPRSLPSMIPSSII
jgi:hypothetical protein